MVIQVRNNPTGILSLTASSGAIKLHEPRTDNNQPFVPTRKDFSTSISSGVTAATSDEATGPQSMETVMYKTSEGLMQISVFVAVVSNENCGAGYARSSSCIMFEKTKVYMADMSNSNCACSKTACTAKCPLVFKELRTVDHGVMAMEAFPRNTQPTHLYFAKFSVNWNQDPSGPNQCDIRTNVVSVLSIGGTAPDYTATNADVVLAGRSPEPTMEQINADRSLAENDQPSYDGTGTDARFLFYHALRGKIDRYSGASLTMYNDTNTGRQFLVVVEGSGQKLRLVDVSTNAAADAKVVTMGSFVAPTEVSRGQGHDFYVMSSNGLLSNIDLYPVVPCRNLWEFTGDMLAAWSNNSIGLAASAKQYDLRRASASDSSTGAPWEISVQQKVIDATSVSQNARIIKKIVCAKPAQGNGNSCCVRKLATGNMTLNDNQKSKLQELLKSA